MADEGTAHSPPPHPIRFSPTAQHEEEDREERNDTEEDADQDYGGDTQQDPRAPKRSEEYLQMEEAIIVLTEEIEDLQYALCATREEGSQYEFPPLAAITTQKKHSGQARRIQSEVLL